MRALIALMLAVTISGMAIPSMAAAADFQARTDLRYQVWSSDAGESGSQFYWPLVMQGTLDRWRIELKAGYATTSGKLENLGEQSIGGILDTKLNGSYTLPKILGVDGLIGMDVNLPTGQTAQDPRDLRIMADADLVTVTSPGEGWNFNPFVNAARRWCAWTFGAGIGYAFQGEYDYSATDRNYDPGDILNLATGIDYNWGGGWLTRLFGQYATFGTDTLAGQDLQKNGNTLLVGISGRYEQEGYGVGLTLKMITRDKSEYGSSAGSGIDVEPHNSYGNEWLIELDGQYHLSAGTTVSAYLTYLSLEANDYPADAIFYADKRTKTALGLIVKHRLSGWLELKGTLEGFYMDDGRNWFHPDAERQYTGWAVSVSAVTRF